jgi:hypothetical protein
MHYELSDTGCSGTTRCSKSSFCLAFGAVYTCGATVARVDFVSVVFRSRCSRGSSPQRDASGRFHRTMRSLEPCERGRENGPACRSSDGLTKSLHVPVPTVSRRCRPHALVRLGRRPAKVNESSRPVVLTRSTEVCFPLLRRMLPPIHALRQRRRWHRRAPRYGDMGIFGAARTIACRESRRGGVL